MIYLASPYSSPDPEIREVRFQAVCRYAAALMAQGLHLYCPIAHTHPIALHGGLPTGYGFWQTYDAWYIDRVDKVVVLKLDGWQESTGVTDEIQRARARGIPVEFVNP